MNPQDRRLLAGYEALIQRGAPLSPATKQDIVRLRQLQHEEEATAPTTPPAAVQPTVPLSHRLAQPSPEQTIIESQKAKIAKLQDFW